MHKWTSIKIVGLVTAMVLIAFGGVGNAWRTLKFAWNKIISE